MALGGARSSTAAEMERVLHLTGNPREASEAVGVLVRQVAEVPECCTLRIANRLFGDARYRFDPAFCTSAVRSFGAPLLAVDFRGAPEAARERINAWVAEQTNDRIRDLIPEGGVDRATRLVLANAIYFLGTWEKPFEPSATRPEPFYGPRGVRDVPMMHRTGRYRLAAVGGAEGAPGAGVKVLDMPYQGGLTMTVVLPDARDGLGAVEAALSHELVGRWLDALAVARVAVSLPRFMLRPGGASLSGPLGALGMRGAFSSAADFTGIANPPDPDDRLFVSGVFHQAFVKVDEKGTEAAAATGVAMAARGISVEPDPIVFRADHPFLFLIRDLRTGAILFIGRVEDPAGSVGDGDLTWNPQPDPPGSARVGGVDTGELHPPAWLVRLADSAEGEAGDPVDWIQENVMDPLHKAAAGTWIEDQRQAQREYLKGTWVKDTPLGKFLRLDAPPAPKAPQPPPARGTPAAGTPASDPGFVLYGGSAGLKPLVLVPEAGDPFVAVDDPIAHLLPTILRMRKERGEPVGPLANCVVREVEWKEAQRRLRDERRLALGAAADTGNAQADQALAGAGQGAKIGAGVGTFLEAVPTIGPILHAAAIVVGVIAGAIGGRGGGHLPSRCACGGRLARALPGGPHHALQRRGRRP